MPANEDFETHRQSCSRSQRPSRAVPAEFADSARGLEVNLPPQHTSGVRKTAFKGLASGAQESPLAGNSWASFDRRGMLRQGAGREDQDHDSQSQGFSLVPPLSRAVCGARLERPGSSPGRVSSGSRMCTRLVTGCWISVGWLCDEGRLGAQPDNDCGRDVAAYGLRLAGS